MTNYQLAQLIRAMAEMVYGLLNQGNPELGLQQYRIIRDIADETENTIDKPAYTVPPN